MHTVVWSIDFQFDTNNLYKDVGFQVLLSNTKNCLQLYGFKYSYRKQILHTQS